MFHGIDITGMITRMSMSARCEIVPSKVVLFLALIARISQSTVELNYDGTVGEPQVVPAFKWEPNIEFAKQVNLVFLELNSASRSNRQLLKDYR